MRLTSTVSQGSEKVGDVGYEERPYTRMTSNGWVQHAATEAELDWRLGR